jgi:hypothetical protein
MLLVLSMLLRYLGYLYATFVSFALSGTVSTNQLHLYTNQLHLYTNQLHLEMKLVRGHSQSR